MNPIKNLIISIGHAYALYQMNPIIAISISFLIPLFAMSDYYFFTFHQSINKKEDK